MGLCLCFMGLLFAFVLWQISPAALQMQEGIPLQARAADWSAQKFDTRAAEWFTQKFDWSLETSSEAVASERDQPEMRPTEIQMTEQDLHELVLKKAAAMRDV